MELDKTSHLVGVKEMAQILGISIGWLYQRTRHGPEAFPHYKVGRHVRFDVQEVLAFIRSGKAAGKEDGRSVS